MWRTPYVEIRYIVVVHELVKQGVEEYSYSDRLFFCGGKIKYAYEMCAERICCLKFPSYSTSVILLTWLLFLKYVHLTLRYIIPLTQVCN